MQKNKLNTNSNILVSFKSHSEISKKNVRLVDILDLKNPDNGSLGEWELSDIKKVVKAFGNEKFISATIGDVLDLEKIIKKIKVFDELKLDFIKFGLFVENTVQMSKFLADVKSCNFKTEFVPVVFADKKIILETVFKNLESFKAFKFNILLLDTFSKQGGDLFKSCSLNYLSNVLIRTKKLGLSLGLAGKLKKNQIPKLLKLQPKIIGFRSAVCKKNNRNDQLSYLKLQNIYHFFKSEIS